MAEGNAVVKRVDLAPELSGVDRLKVMFAAKGTTPSDWARSRGFSPQQVSMCMTGARRYHAIRDAIAEFLEKPRNVVDLLIDGPSAPPEESAA